MPVSTPSPEGFLPALSLELRPCYDKLVTEDDTPVDGIYSEKLMRLLTESLYASWPGPGGNRTFLALANVGLFYGDKTPAIVPHVFLSLDVQVPQDPFPKESRSYFLWRYEKAPEVVIEIVSNTEGEEDGKKLAIYAKIGIPYYVIWDPENLLKGGRLRVFELHVRQYQPKNDLWFPEVNLGLTIWHGIHENLTSDWLRWCDGQGQLVLTGRERADKASDLAKKADERADKAEERAQRLEAKLRALGIEPNGK